MSDQPDLPLSDADQLRFLKWFGELDPPDRELAIVEMGKRLIARRDPAVAKVIDDSKKGFRHPLTAPIPWTGEEGAVLTLPQALDEFFNLHLQNLAGHDWSRQLRDYFGIRGFYDQVIAPAFQDDVPTVILGSESFVEVNADKLLAGVNRAFGLIRKELILNRSLGCRDCSNVSLQDMMAFLGEWRREVHAALVGENLPISTHQKYWPDPLHALAKKIRQVGEVIRADPPPASPEAQIPYPDLDPENSLEQLEQKLDCLLDMLPSGGAILWTTGQHGPDVGMELLIGALENVGWENYHPGD